jgi:8-oxo-dGTP pyrophosphatase MutT (NUDIX family)
MYVDPKQAEFVEANTFAKQFSLRHVFRAGAIIWCKYRGKDYYVVFKSITRPNRGTQLPGGRIERSENFAETILREVQEESGIQTRIICPLGFLYYENAADNYSNMQLYYIVRPLFKVDVFKKWKHIDKDLTKQELECWCVPVDEPTNFLAAGQAQVVDMFKVWLEDHKKKTENPRPKHLNKNHNQDQRAENNPE